MKSPICRMLSLYSDRGTYRLRPDAVYTNHCHQNKLLLEKAVPVNHDSSTKSPSIPTIASLISNQNINQKMKHVNENPVPLQVVNECQILSIIVAFFIQEIAIQQKSCIFFNFRDKIVNEDWVIVVNYSISNENFACLPLKIA